MRPDVVTFWHGPLDGLRQTCLRSQVAAGHKVTVYSFDPPPRLARRRRQCRGRSDPAARFLRSAAPAAAGRLLARLDHIAIQRFFPDAADGRERRPVARCRRAAAQAGRDRSGKALFRLGAPAPARQFGSVPAAGRSDRDGVRRPDGTGRTDAGLAGAAPSPHLRATPPARRIETASPTFASRSLDRPRSPRSPAAPANCGTRCRSNRFTPCMPSRNCFSSQSDFSKLLADPAIIGLHVSPKGRGGQKPVPGSLYAWAAEKFGMR